MRARTLDLATARRQSPDRNTAGLLLLFIISMDYVCVFIAYMYEFVFIWCRPIVPLNSRHWGRVDSLITRNNGIQHMRAFAMAIFGFTPVGDCHRYYIDR